MQASLTSAIIAALLVAVISCDVPTRRIALPQYCRDRFALPCEVRCKWKIIYVTTAAGLMHPLEGRFMVLWEVCDES